LFEVGILVEPVEDNILESKKKRLLKLRSDIIDKCIKGDITINEFTQFLEFIQPKQLNLKSELTGYS